MTLLTERQCWRALSRHYQDVKDLHLRELFAADPGRGGQLVAEGAGLYLDYSKNRATAETIRLLLALAGSFAAIARCADARPCSRRHTKTATRRIGDDH